MPVHTWESSTFVVTLQLYSEESNYTLLHSGDGNKSNLPLLFRGPFDRIVDQMPLYGYPGLLFYAIQVIALLCLSLSTLFCLFLISFLCLFRKIKERHSLTARNDQANPASIKAQVHSSPSNHTFKNWRSGDRLVIYLTIADLSYSVSHIVDKAYYAYAERNPPDTLCSVVGFFFQEFMFAQWIIIVFTAINACSLVVFNKRLHLGRSDWKLLVVAFGTPAVNGTIAISLGLLGQSGAWCFIDLRTQAGNRYSQGIFLILIAIFGFVSIAYGSIWFKIKRSSVAVDSTTERYRKSAKVMLIFVAVFVFQWWPLVLMNIWTMFAPAPTFIPVLTGSIVNLGGFFNCVVYIIIRKRFQQQVAPQESIHVKRINVY